MHDWLRRKRSKAPEKCISARLAFELGMSGTVHEGQIHGLLHGTQSSSW